MRLTCLWGPGCFGDEGGRAVTIYVCVRLASMHRRKL